MQKEVLEKIAALITAAFGLIAALAWNEAIQEIFRLIFGDQSGVWAMIFYAAVVTMIAVVVTIWLGRVAEKATGRKSRRVLIVNYLRRRMLVGGK